MKVLIISDDPVRGASETIVWGLDKYTDIEARGLSKQSKRWALADWEPGRFWNIHDRRQREEALGWADVCHFLHSQSYRTIGRPDLIGKKPAVWQMFTQWDKGTREAEWYPKLWKKEDFPHIRRALIAEGWGRYNLWEGHEYKLLPMIFPLWTHILPDWEQEPIRQVSFATMSRKKGLVAPKAVRGTIRALKGVRLDWCFRVPWKECVERKRRSWVGIDEVETPIFHFSGFEYLALGVPCISRYDMRSENDLKAVTGAAAIPFIDAEMGTLRETCEAILDIPLDIWNEERKMARNWMSTYYEPSKMIRHYVDLYQKL